jgi:MoaA/NifB/PqqE/SkfB family radical SAM enzyme
MSLSSLFKKTHPFLDWIQVEISSFCNCKCVYCPHTEYSEHWQNRLLPIELFRKLTPAFARTKLIHLQGWGEPFTHPQFIDFLRLAKKAGCTVGTTTNGTILGPEKIKACIYEGLDIICFSLAGVDEKNDLIRKGTHIRKVLKCIEEIHRVKKSCGTDNPKIHIAYMLMRSGLDDLHKIPYFVGNAGISQTIISSLSLVVNPAMKVEAELASDRTRYLELINNLHQIREAATNLGTEIYFNVVSLFTKEFHCSENITRALVVGSDGSVSPCVMAQIPVDGDNFYYFRGKRETLRKLTFGNIAHEPLNTIWHRKEYKSFIRSFIRGGVHSFCQNCLKRFIWNLQKDSDPYQIQLDRFFSS